jgi:MSHA biogenesis protein MshK
MAERLMRSLTFLVLLAALPAVAQGLADPTRPPSGATLSTSAPAAAAAGPRLQSVLISPGRKLAIIDGETIALGGNVGDATLVQVTETGVTLRRGAELTRLELYPDVMRNPGRRAVDENTEGKP